MKTWADFGLDVPATASGEYLTTCPQCSSQRKKKHAKCLSANVDEGVWVCFHCGWSGTLKTGGQRNELHWQKPQYRKPEARPLVDLPAKALKFFSDRGISQETLRAFKITVAKVYMPQIEEQVAAIMFPYMRGGELINAKYRDNLKNFRMEAGAERLLFNVDAIGERVVIVEGEMDALAVYESGCEIPAVSVPDGAPVPTAKDYESKFSFLESAQEALDAAVEVVIAVDSDEPGKRLEDELARRIGREKCKRVTWPEDCKDANDVLVKHGHLALQECIAAAQPFPINGVFSVIDLSDKVDVLWERGWERGHSTGFANLDEYYTVRPGEFTVVTGIPNSGKSNFLDHLMVKLANRHGWRFAIFSPENQPLEDHMARMLEKYTGMPFAQGKSERMSADQRDEAKLWLNDHFRWILPDEDADWTVENVLEKAKGLVFQFGIKGLLIDPWNELESGAAKDETETQYISRTLKRIRQFGRRYGVHVWVVAHPMKLQKDKEGNYPIPTPYDISGSAHWRNKADNCLAVWRDLINSESRHVEVHVSKVRFRQIGRIGHAQFEYMPVTATYGAVA